MNRPKENLNFLNHFNFSVLEGKPGKNLCLRLFWTSHFVSYIDVWLLCCTPETIIILYVGFNWKIKKIFEDYFDLKKWCFLGTHDHELWTIMNYHNRLGSSALTTLGKAVTVNNLYVLWVVHNTYECSTTTWKVTHQNTIHVTFCLTLVIMKKVRNI